MFQGTERGLLYYNLFPILRYWVYLIKIIQETLALKYISTFLLHHLVSIYDRLRNYDPRVKSLDHWFSLFLVYTVKPAHVVTSIKGHIFFCTVIENVVWIEPLLECHLSYKVTFSLSQYSILKKIFLVMYRN